ncbi:hypothetical protein [Chelativorans salis]|uniref:Uncharacterized protein n=1 Tax=Chelativorans salis TaxID=2978478 RepID=A0ABT2LJP3_9HYPH|nr:hypothetical protein [Chelativorans sp. EGI FJ00035]MCT7374642.1 hypothetical protein [Chelativorans sp. EGI FJ00035]
MKNIFLGLQIPVLIVLAMQASLLAREIGALQQRIEAAPVIRAETEQRRACEEAIWPAIPEPCLERVSAVRTD